MISIKRNTEHGSVHVIIIGILVVALIGAIGFIFWQNFINKSSDESSKTASTKQSSTQVTESDTKDETDSKKYVAIDPWGVKFDAPTDGTTIKWEVLADNKNAVGFSTSNLVEKDICTAGYSAAGGMSRSKEKPQESFTSPPTPLNDGKPLDGYYYSFSVPNGQHCDDQDPNDYQEAKKILELAKTLQSTK